MMPDPSGTVWSIGDESLDPSQFSAGWFSGVGSPSPEFRVGVSDPAADWPRVQPGPLNAATGFRSCESVVVFDVAEQELLGDAGFELVVDVVASNGPCPQLEVEINGVRGLFFLDPVRRGCADAHRQPSPITGPAHLVAALPAGCLRPAGNRLVVRTVAVQEPEPGELRAQALPLGHWFGSAITWNRLALRLSGAPWVPVVSCEPLPLYVTRGDALMELADVRVRVATAFTGGTVRLQVGGHRVEADMSLQGRDFGDAWVRVAVPEVETPVPARVQVRGDGFGVEETFTFRPARKWTLHLLPHVHLDIGYTDVQAKVMELHSRNLERAAGLIEATPEYCFTVDGNQTVHEFLRTRGGKTAASALAAMSDGRIAVNAFSLLFLSGLAGLEEVYRSAYRGLALRDEHAVTVRHAHLTDVPSYSWAIPSVVAGLGLDGFFGIQNHNRGGNPDSDELHLRSPLRWAGPDGAEVLAFFADCYTQLRFICADPPTVVGMVDGLSRYLRRYEREDYLPADLPIVGTHTDNEDLGDGYADLVARWNARYAFPRLVFSTFPRYLAAVAPLRDQLPRLAGDGGSYWEDGAGTQAAAIARYRDAQTRLAGAETLCALTALTYSGVGPDRGRLDEAWDHLLFGCEHTWTAAHATARPHAPSVADERDWKIHQIEAAWQLATDETRRGLSQLGELLALRAPALLVVNPTGRDRALTCVHELPTGTELTPADSGEPIPLEVVGYPGPEVDEGPHDGHVMARFTVPAVPAFGYRVLRPTPTAQPLTPAPLHRDRVISTGRYRIVVEAGDGRVRSLCHRGSGRELLDQASPYTLSEVLYVTGGGDAAGRGLGEQMTGLMDYDPDLPAARLQVHHARMHYLGHRRVGDGDLLLFTGSGPTLPAIRTELRVFDDADRVEMVVSVRKQAELAKESVYVAFPFAVPDPTLRYDRQIGWVDPAVDGLPGSCHDWFCAQHGAAVSNAEVSITWASADTPLFTSDDVVRGRWATTTAPRTGTLLSWVMNNYWWTNTPAWQAGEASFRYAFTPGSSFDQAAATRFVRDLRAPVLLDELTYQDRTRDGVPQLAAAAGTLLHLDLPDTLHAHLYAARHTDGLLLRLEETTGHPATARLRHPVPGGRIHRCTAAEARLDEITPDPDGRYTVQVGPYQVISVTLTM